jgi:ribosomal subunit interface protein
MGIKWNIITKNMRAHDQLHNKLEQKIGKLATHLEHFPDDTVQLHVMLERHPKKTCFDAALTLRLPSNILRAEKSAPDPVPAFDLAIKALLREIASLKSDLRHESQWQRVPSKPLPSLRSNWAST